MKTRKQIKKNQVETRYNFARQIRLLREGAGLSIKEMAQQIFISETFLQKQELGEIEHIGTIFAIAQFFDKKVEINLV
ncbi:MAG: helix-turn-helix domain-containing protein [Alphaproteobacteria bacterium]|nr:helix-turn-helix domain-containing protein [Alphaproteobacteria bacterium]